MEGMDPANLKKANEKPWSGDAKREATNIRNAWISIRKDMLGVMLNGLRMEMATAKKIDAIEGGRRGLEAHLTRVRNKIIELEVIAKEGGEGTKYDLNMQEVGNLGLTESSTYQLEHRKGYMPHHILRIREHLTEFNDYMHSNTAETPEVAFREFVDFSNQTGTPDRAKSRRALTEPGYSRNPLFFIHKYIHDISRYNHSRAINDILVDTWGELRKSKDFAKGTAEQAEVDRSIDSALKLLNNLGEESFIGGSIGGKSNFGMKATRLLTSLGFIRAMAGSGRTAIRNYAGGRLMSVMEHGYYKNNSGKKYIEKNAELGSALTRELERYGLLWHRDSVELKDLIRDYTKGANMAAATRGSVEEGMLPPGMSEVRNAKGEVIGVTITNDAAFERTIRSVERVAGVGSILNQKIENTLRPQVFKAVFATAHKNIAELPDWYKAEQMGRSKENPPTMEEMNAWVIREAGKAAYDGVLASQFEYADVSKADVLSKHKVIGQFRHYMFELANWRQKTFREGWRAYKAAAKTGDVSMLSNYSAMKNYRMGLGIMLGNMLTMMTGYGFYNILEAEDIQQAMNFMKIVTANPDTPEGRKSIEQASYGAGLASNLGITFSTVLELAKLMQWVNIDEEDKFFMASLTEGKPLSLPQDEWNFRMLRLANLQMARTRYQSGPDFMDGNTTRGLLVETGLYTDYEHRKAREGLLKQGNKLLGRKYRQRSKKNKPKTDEQIRQEALQVLSALGL
jgi:hypothetical protein